MVLYSLRVTPLRYAWCCVPRTLLCYTQRSRSNLPRLACKRACRLALRRLSGAGNNPMVWVTGTVTLMTCCCCGSDWRGLQVIREANYNEIHLRWLKFSSADWNDGFAVLKCPHEKSCGHVYHNEEKGNFISRSAQRFISSGRSPHFKTAKPSLGARSAQKEKNLWRIISS